MNDEKEIIAIFLKEKSILENSSVVGIIFYGSRKYKFNTDISDIDLLIITNNKPDFKGVSHVNNIRIEYFVKSISSLLEQIESIATSQDNSLLSIFKNGELIQGDEISFNYLKSQIDFERKVPKKKKSSQISSYLRKTEQTDNKFYKHYFYYNLIDMIRKKYHEENGYCSLNGQKAYNLYENREYAEMYYCLKLPDQDFIKLYKEAIEEGYNNSILSKLLAKVDCEKETSSFYQPFSKQEIKSYSAVVETSLTRSVKHLTNNNIESLNSYYLAIEKIRILYCMINRLNYNIEYFNEEYDSEFLKHFDIAIKNASIESITNLFDFTVKSLSINYKEYKVLDLK